MMCLPIYGTVRVGLSAEKGISKYHTTGVAIILSTAGLSEIGSRFGVSVDDMNMKCTISYICGHKIMHLRCGVLQQ